MDDACLSAARAQDAPLPPAVLGWVAGLPRPRVVVIARSHSDAERETRNLPASVLVRTILLGASEGPQTRGERLHHDLTVAGRQDLIVDVCRGPGGPDRLRRAALHLRVDGVLLVALPRQADAPARQALEQCAHELLTSQADPGLREPTRRDRRPWHQRDRDALAASVKDVAVEDGWLRLRCARGLLARLPEDRANAYLAARPDRGRVLDVVPATTWRPHGRLASTDPAETRADQVDCPELSLREYRDVTVEPRMAAHADGVLLPASLRDPWVARGSSRGVVDWSPGFARTARARTPKRALEGAWFYLDNPFRGHFGHAYTEQLGQLWAWERARAEHGDLRLLMLGGPDVAGWELDLLEAAGVPRDRVHAAGGAVRVETLVTATPAYVIGRYVHPVLRPLYNQVGSSLREQARPRDAPGRLFVTRGGEQRPCRNAAEVEQLVEQHGFEVLAPETLSLAEQAGRFARAGTVAGFGGSGLLHVLTAPVVQRLLVVSNETYHVANEKLVAGFLGLDVDIFRARSEIVTRHFSQAMFHSAHTVDWSREGAALRETLAGLLAEPRAPQ